MGVGQSTVTAGETGRRALNVQELLAPLDEDRELPLPDKCVGCRWREKTTGGAS